MADEHDGPVDLVDDRRDVGGVGRDPAKRIRGCDHRVLASVEPVEHGAPARGVSERAMDEHDRRLGHVVPFRLGTD
jgi:hypothetical protein